MNEGEVKQIYISKLDMHKVAEGCDLGDSVDVRVYLYPHRDSLPNLIRYGLADAHPPTQVSGEEFCERINSAFDLAQHLKKENCPGVSFPVIHMIVRSARKGMVPASEVQSAYQRGFKEASDSLEVIICDRVRAERERCAKLVHDSHGNFGVKTANLILNPPEPK